MQLQQQCITQRLATLTSTNQIDRVQPAAATVRVATSEPTESRVFRIGDRVRITNPKAHQQNIGSITKIGKTNITITTTSGFKIFKHLTT